MSTVAITPMRQSARALAISFFMFCFWVMLPLWSARTEDNYTPEYSANPPIQQKTYLFGVHPLHNPQRLDEVYGPIVDFLNKNLNGAKIRLVASRSYEEFDTRLRYRYFDFALPNPYQTITAMQFGYRVFGKMGNDSEFRGIILIRKDSGISKITDLKGKAISFPAPTALAACMMPLYYLHSSGLDVNHDIKRLFSGSQESSIMNVYLGKSAAGVTWPVPWKSFVQRNPDIAAMLVVKWETPPLVNNSLIVRDDVPKEIVDKVASLLFALHMTEDGRELLSAIPLEKFESASDRSYQPVSEFMEKYNSLIH